MEFEVSHYREVEITFQEIFPRYKKLDIKEYFEHLKDPNPHKTILNVAFYMSEFGYNQILDRYCFHQEDNYTFSNHCHQCTPALGLVLKNLGFKHVHYLECYKIEKQAFEQGFVRKLDPLKEKNSKNRAIFSSIGRIPYCCLEVNIEGKKYYISGKHIKLLDGKPQVLLTPNSYADFTGILHHPQDQTKSGIYLKTIKPNVPSNIDFNEEVVWIKQTYEDPEPEYFYTFLRMNLQE